MTRRWFVPTAVFAAVLMVVLSLVAGGRSITAQDTAATPAAGASAETVPHPGHIHAGTCDTLGAVVFSLTDAAAPGLSGTPVAGSAASPVATPAASPVAGMGPVVAESITTSVGADLATIVTGGHAINFHESAENIANYIACGDIVGDGTETELTITLNELNASGYEGMATLTDNGDGTTDVTVTLSRTEGGSATPTA